MYTVATQCYFPVAVGARREERNLTPGMHCANVGTEVLRGVGFCKKIVTRNRKTHSTYIEYIKSIVKAWFSSKLVLLRDFKEFFIRTLMVSYNQ